MCMNVLFDVDTLCALQFNAGAILYTIKPNTFAFCWWPVIANIAVVYWLIIVHCVHTFSSNVNRVQITDVIVVTYSVQN